MTQAEPGKLILAGVQLPGRHALPASFLHHFHAEPPKQTLRDLEAQ